MGRTIPGTKGSPFYVVDYYLDGKRKRTGVSGWPKSPSDAEMHIKGLYPRAQHVQGHEPVDLAAGIQSLQKTRVVLAADAAELTRVQGNENDEQELAEHIHDRQGWEKPKKAKKKVVSGAG